MTTVRLHGRVPLPLASWWVSSAEIRMVLTGLEVMASQEAQPKPPQFSNNHNFPKIDPKDKN